MNKKLIFKITTERLILRNLKVADVAVEYVQWLNDPQFKRYLTHSTKKFTIASCRKFVRSYACCRDKALIGIFLRTSHTHIGNITISSIDWQNRFIVVGIGIGHKGCARKGFAFEAMNAIMRLFFDDFGINSIQAGINVNNLKSLNLFLKCGFKIEGHLRQTNFIGGEFQDAYIVSCLKQDFIYLYPKACKKSI